MKQPVLVVVPVAGLSRLTEEGISAALSLGDDVVAVTVAYTEPDGDAGDARGDCDSGTGAPEPGAPFHEQWQA